MESRTEYSSSKKGEILMVVINNTILMMMMVEGGLFPKTQLPLVSLDLGHVCFLFFA